jgi:DNA-binding NarL/FixJ family response regulator
VAELADVAERGGGVGAMVRVLIVDDHRMFAESLARLLGDEDGIDVIGLAASSEEGVDAVERLRPDVVLVDYRMPDRDGVATAATIKELDPACMVVMLTGSEDDRVLLGAIDAGCSGFLTKDRAAGEVARAVRAAASGEALISPAQLARLLPRLSSKRTEVGTDLTRRELELLTHLARGSSNKAIAADLHLSLNTVRNYVQSVLTKLDAHSKLEAVATAVREGVIDYPSAV